VSVPRLLTSALALLLLYGCGRRAPVARILLVTIDTLRWDRLGYMGYDVATPNLDRLAQSGAIFTQAISSAPITLPAHSSILSGLYPTSHGARFNGIFRLSDEIETVAESLKREGFATGAFVGAFVLDRRFGLAQGFDVYDDELPGGNSDTLQFAERRGEEVVARAMAFIEERREDRWFVWVHLYDPHLPHDAPAPYAERYPDRAYDAEIAYTDAALEPLLAAANDEETAVIVIGDHGEGLGEHGESSHTLFVYDSTMRVPLLVKAPGVEAGTRVEGQVRSVDVAPTILQLGGASSEATMDGSSLLAPSASEGEGDLAAYGETFGTLYQFHWSELRFLRRDGFKFIEAPRPELYDLGSDPGETRNLWSHDSPPEIGKRLRRELDRAAKAEKESPVGAIDEETKRRLESLGYVASSTRARTGVLPDPKDRVDIFERTQKLLARDVPPEAQIEGFREILALEPENLMARKRIAGLLAQQGRLEEAVTEYQNVLRVAEFDTKDWENLLSALLLLDRSDEALALLDRALSEFPWHDDLQVLKGEALEESGQLAEARGAYAKAIELSPGEAENYWRRGTLSLKLDDDAGAERDFRESLDRDPSFEEGRLALSRLLSETGRQAEAIGLLGDAGTAGAKAALAEAHIASSRYDEAKALLEEALALEPENTRALALMGPLYGRAGDLAAAAKTLEKAVALGETSPEIRRNLALVYSQQGRLPKAIAELQKASEEAPSDASIWFALGNAQLRSGNGRHAVPAFEKALELKSDWPEATFNLALAYQSSGQPKKAAELYRRFLSTSGDAERRAEAEKRLAALESR
jgi:arylsulfatase A-like enzyme/tetratricopeptide (TPR) repeat protein